MEEFIDIDVAAIQRTLPTRRVRSTRQELPASEPIDSIIGLAVALVTALMGAMLGYSRHARAVARGQCSELRVRVDRRCAHGKRAFCGRCVRAWHRTKSMRTGRSA